MSESEQMFELFRQQMDMQRKQMEALVDALAGRLSSGSTPKPPTVAIPTFFPFDATSELWTDYWARFLTFLGANSVPDDKAAQIFLTNQTKVTYKLLGNLASQQTPPKDVNELTLNEIQGFMKSQFDPMRYVVRERFKFWSEMQRKPGETVLELAARIRHDAVRCDFPSIRDPQDEAMRTRFMCSVNNEAVLKALFKVKDDELTFAKALQIALETEEAAKVAKETVYGSKQVQASPSAHAVHRVQPSKQQSPTSPTPAVSKHRSDFPRGTCPRCGKKDHGSNECPFKETVCNYCQKMGHIQAACLKKKREQQPVRTISKHSIQTVKVIDSIPQVQQPLRIKGQEFTFEVDTGAGDNFCSMEVWTKLGKPALEPASCQYKVANGQPLATLGTFQTVVSLQGENPRSSKVQFTVSKTPRLNLLGRDAIVKLGVDIPALLGVSSSCEQVKGEDVFAISYQPDLVLQQACEQLCTEFPELFKPGLGCLKDYQLEVKFKPDAKPVFCKPRVVPFALLEDLNQAYDAGIAQGVWKPVQFNTYGTPVVPLRKAATPDQAKAKLRVCGDYSVSVNPQLEPHRHPMHLPEDLMRKLGGGHGYTKIDLADAYNQVMLGPESQKRLALSTHRGVLLQLRLPFGISSAPGYFQEIMDQLISDLRGVTSYMDDILVSGANASEHLQNLRALLQRLQDKGLRCRKEKYLFARASVEYLGYTLSSNGVSKGRKADAVRMMPAPTNVSSLRSFLGAIQFYNKFLPNMATVTDPLYRLTKKNVQWQWGAEQQAAFQSLKDLLCTDTVLAHFDHSLPIGISCDASECGLGAVLFHRYPDGGERPISNVSKTLTDTQRKYSQIQKEALAIVFALSKFHQFLYGRKFILVTDHKPLLALFGPNKATPLLAANRLARWALLLNQYSYSIEYRKTTDHGNADALSRLPLGPDPNFDREEGDADVDTVCAIRTISLQLNPTDPGVLSKESAKDPVLAKVMLFTREGWSPKAEPEDQGKDYSVEDFRTIAASLSTFHGCLLYGSRVVIPPSLQPQVLELLHLGHFGMQRMKQLARTAVYWPRIDTDIMNQCQRCSTCAEHRNLPAKAPNHPWMVPEKPWSRLHLDHAINFMGTNWLVLIDAYSKYPCIHPVSSTSSKATTELLEQDFAHFGYPHTIVTDNATSFVSEEFQAWCKERGITHLTGAPYHPATNGAAERLVQTFKQALNKSSLPPRAAVLEFLMQYRRTPLASGYSPSEILNGRQIRCKIDILLPSPAHIAQAKQATSTSKAPPIITSHSQVERVAHIFKAGDPCYALYCGPRRNKDPRWVPAVVTKVFGPRSVNVHVYPRGPTWRRHIEQLQYRYGSSEDADPGELTTLGNSAEPSLSKDNVPAQSGMIENTEHSDPVLLPAKPKRVQRNPRLPTGNEYGPEHPRRSTRNK